MPARLADGLGPGSALFPENPGKYAPNSWVPRIHSLNGSRLLCNFYLYHSPKKLSREIGFFLEACCNPLITCGNSPAHKSIQRLMRTCFLIFFLFPPHLKDVQKSDADNPIQWISQDRKLHPQLIRSVRDPLYYRKQLRQVRPALHKVEVQELERIV